MYNANKNIIRVITILVIGLWFSHNTALQAHIVNTNPVIGDAVHVVNEVVGVYTGEVPLEKYLNLHTIAGGLGY